MEFLAPSEKCQLYPRLATHTVRYPVDRAAFKQHLSETCLVHHYNPLSFDLRPARHVCFDPERENREAESILVYINCHDMDMDDIGSLYEHILTILRIFKADGAKMLESCHSIALTLGFGAHLGELHELPSAHHQKKEKRGRKRSRKLEAKPCRFFSSFYEQLVDIFDGQGGPQTRVKLVFDAPELFMQVKEGVDAEHPGVNTLECILRLPLTIPQIAVHTVSTLPWSCFSYLTERGLATRQIHYGPKAFTGCNLSFVDSLVLSLARPTLADRTSLEMLVAGTVSPFLDEKVATSKGSTLSTQQLLLDNADSLFGLEDTFLNELSEDELFMLFASFIASLNLCSFDKKLFGTNALTKKRKRRHAAGATSADTSTGQAIGKLFTTTVPKHVHLNRLLAIYFWIIPAEEGMAPSYSTALKHLYTLVSRKYVLETHRKQEPKYRVNLEWPIVERMAKKHKFDIALYLQQGPERL